MHPIFTAFLNTSLQFACITAILFVTGFVIGWLARCINSVYSSFMFPRLGLYLFGLIGIPAHEFSHYIFCKVFRLEVTKVKWFDVKGKGGAHGAVTHNYDPSNPIHRLAHLFIGFAPILLLPVAVAGLFWFLFPGAEQIVYSVQNLKLGSLSHHNLWDWRTAVFLYLSFSLVAHMDLSKEDLKIASSGLPVLFFVLLLGNSVALLFSVNANRLLETFAYRVWEIWSPVFGICLAIGILQLFLAWIATSAIHLIFRQPPIRVLP